MSVQAWSGGTPSVRLEGLDPVGWLESLVDQGTLRLAADGDGCGVVAASGLVHGRAVHTFACDPRQGGGALGEAGSARIVATIEAAVRSATPVVGLWHCGGARLQEGTSSLDGIGRVFRAIVHASGRVPQLSVVLGPAAGGAAYGSALGDFVIAGPRSRIFVTGPDVVRQVTGETVDGSVLGGPDQHARLSGLVHVVESSDAAACDAARCLVTVLGRRRPRGESLGADPRLCNVLPTSPRRAYDVHRVVDLLLDGDAPRVELHGGWARNVVTMLGRLDGGPVGVLANNPLHLAGCLDSSASEKAARFVRTCDSLGIPLVVLVDVPGYLPGRTQEADGIVRRGAKLLHAFAEAVVPRVTVILRKAYGGAFVAMNSKALGATQVLAWPSAQVGVMDPGGAVLILHRRLLAQAPPHERPALLARLSAAYERDAGGLARATAEGHVDRVIDPAMTRSVLAAALAFAQPGQGSHSNIPL